jgi:hypothetical protein
VARLYAFPKLVERAVKTTEFPVRSVLLPETGTLIGKRRNAAAAAL